MKYLGVTRGPEDGGFRIEPAEMHVPPVASLLSKGWAPSSTQASNPALLVAVPWKP